MDDAVLRAVLVELSKEAGIAELWNNLREVLPSVRQAKADVHAHFKSEDPDRWDKLIDQASKSPEIIRQLKRHPNADPKLVQHTLTMADLRKAKPLGKVHSTHDSGSEYEVRKLPGGRLGCTCRDWRFRGSTNADYKCKHIKAYEAGHTKSASFLSSTMSFFDELARINEERRHALDDHYDSHDRPFSNLLTQDEEPTDYNPRPAAPIDEPEIIIGGVR